ncbi:MAG: YfiR family protein [Syntrophales bacterium]
MWHPYHRCQNRINYLFLHERKLRFEINVDAARRAGLKVSSQVLRLGKVIRESSGSE